MLVPALVFQLLLPQSLQRLPVDPLIEKGVTPFHVLQINFDRASSVGVRELNRSLVGRCFFLDSPNTPVASVLAVSSGKTSELGPAFLADDYRRLTPLIAPGVKASKLKHLDRETNRAIEKAVTRFADFNAYPVSSGGSLVIEGLRTVDHQRRDYSLRTLKNFILLRLTCEDAPYCLNTREGALLNRVIADAGESPAICYYWR